MRCGTGILSTSSSAFEERILSLRLVACLIGIFLASPPAGAALEPFQPAEPERQYISMRDGVRIYLEVYKPDVPGASFPTLLLRTPYDNVLVPPETRGKKLFPEFVSRGYAVVRAEVRGTGISEGKFGFLARDGEDGCDTIAWILEQPWCDGNIGTMGHSYLGMNQFPVAGRKPPGLKAMFVGVTGADLYAEMAYPGGVLSTGLLTWAIRHIGHLAPPFVPQLNLAPDPIDSRLYEFQEKVHVERLKETLASVLEGGALYNDAFVRDWIAHPTDGPFWQKESPQTFFKDIEIPIHCWGGWYDYFITGTVRAFEEINAPKKLTVGPWFHPQTENPECVEAQIRWFDYWLKGIDNGVLVEPAVRYYAPGLDEWREDRTWPPKTESLRYALTRQEESGTEGPSGALMESKSPSSSVAPDEIAHDPEIPIPAVAFRNADVRRAEERALVYTTPPFAAGRLVAGRPKLTLYASSDAPDVDWFVRLCEVLPDGQSIVFTSGVLKASQARSHAQPEQVNSHEVYRLEIALAPVCRFLPAGCRLRLSVGNSQFPGFRPNPLPSRSRVYLDKDRPSSLEVPMADSAP